MSNAGDDSAGDNDRRTPIRRSAIIVPERRPTYGKTPEWVEKSTKDFLENLPSRNHLKSLKYTKPELRERLKKQIMSGSKGGRPGQWSARKAQLLALAYRKAGGGYRGKPGKSQQSLKKWTKERWTTVDGKPALRRGKMSRYLPAKAWQRLTPAQRRATIAKKLAGDKVGKQFVPNTERAEAASKKIRKRKSALYSSPSTKTAMDVNNEMRLSFEKPTILISSLQPVKLPDNSTAIVKPIMFEHNEMNVVIPTITETGELLSDSQAIEKYLTSNWHLGKFGDPQAAERYMSILKDGDVGNMSTTFMEIEDDTDTPPSKKRYIDARAIRNNKPEESTIGDLQDKPTIRGRDSYMSMFGASK